jgi:hypothetical protein
MTRVCVPWSHVLVPVVANHVETEPSEGQKLAVRSLRIDIVAVGLAALSLTIQRSSAFK